MTTQHSILIADSIEAFATLLKESLERNGAYRVIIATSGDAALQALADTRFDLAIVDMGLASPDGAMVAHALRQQAADLRLMVIPIKGEEIPPELGDIEIHGVLPKPFFLPELPGRIAEALAGSTPRATAGPHPPSASQPEQPVASSPEQLDIVRQHIPEIIEKMSLLTDDIGAQAALLMCGGKLVAHTGQLSAEEASSLAAAATQTWHTSASTATSPGQERLHFEPGTKNSTHTVYSLAVAGDTILSVVIPPDSPLGIIRQRARDTAEALQTLCAG